MPNNANIDERVVEMKIDNRQFVDGANKTISVLDKLKDALNFKDADKGLNDVQKSIDKFDLTGLASDVEAISSRFSTLGVVGTQALKNLTDKAVNFVESTVRSLTIEPVTAGFQKYEDVLRSTYTILAATKEEILPERYGTQLEYVNDQLAALNWYTDETSWNLQDMVNNVGKFTNAGVGLEEAVVAMQGIGNWASQAGATTQEASRAMYNLSQAMSVGVVKLMDWRSIENANMATREFKQQVLETAVELGTLTRAADGTYKTLSGAAVSATNFNEALSEGWFTGDVLKQTLWDYGEFSRRLQSVMHDTNMENFGFNSFQVMDWIDAIEAGEMTLEEWHETLESTMGKAAPSIESLQYSFDLLTDAEIANSRAAFEMGQEYHTFRDVIDATKDAVSTGWMKTFQTIIGDADQAKEVWGEVGDVFYDIFASGAATRNSILGFWADPSKFTDEAYQDLVSGRESLLNGIRNLYEGIRTYIDPIVNSFNKFFSLIGEGTAEDGALKILDLTYAFEEFSEKVALSDEAMEGMGHFFDIIFGGAKKVLGVFKPILRVFSAALGYLKDFVEIFFESFATGEFDLDYFLGGTSDVLAAIAEGAGNAWTALTSFFDTIKNSTAVQGALSFISGLFGDIFAFVSDSGLEISDFRKGVESTNAVVEKTEGFLDKIGTALSKIKIDTDKIREYFGKVGEVIATVYEGFVGDPEAFKTRIKNSVTKALEGVKEALGEIKFSDMINGARVGTLLYIGMEFAGFVKSFKDSAKKFESIPESISGVFNSISDSIKSFGKAKAADTMLKAAAAILILTVAMVGLSFVPTEKLVEVATVIGILMAIMLKFSKNIGEMGAFSRNKTTVTLLPKMAADLIAFAIFVIAAANAIAKIGQLNDDEVGRGLTVVGLLVLGIAGAVVALDKLSSGGDLKIGTLAKIIIFAATISAAANAMSKLKDLQWGQILSAGFSFLLVLGGMAAVLAVAKDATAGGGLGALLTMLGVVAVMYAMVPLLLGVAAYINKNTGEGLMSALVLLASVAAVALGFTALVAKIGSAKGALKGAGMLLMISAAFVLFGASLAISVPPILVLLTGFVELLATIEEVSKSMKDIGKALAILLGLGFAMVLIGAGAVLLGAGLVTAGAGFLMFSAGLVLVTVSATALTAVLPPLATAFATVCTILADHAVAIIGVIAVLTILGILVSVLGKKFDIINKVMTGFGKIMKALVQYGPQILGMLAIVLSGVLEFVLNAIPMVVDFLVRGIVIILNGTADSIRSNAQGVVSAIENLLAAILELVVRAFFTIFGDIVMLLLKPLEKLIGPELFSVMDTIFNSMGDYCADGIASVVGKTEKSAEEHSANVRETMLTNMRVSAADVEDALSGIPEGTTNTMNQSALIAGNGAPILLESFNNSLLNGAPSLQNTMGDVFGSAFDLDFAGAGETSGANFVIGAGNGAIGESEWLNKVMETIANNGAGSFASAWEINSPSKVASGFGRYWDIGLVNGLLNNAGTIDETATSLAFKMVDSIRNAMTSIYAIADGDFSLSPVITPVVDMSNVDSAAGGISGLFGGNAVANISRVGRSMADLEDLASNMQNISEARANMSQDSYEINIYPSSDMDEEAIAEAVVDRISSGITRKGVALG